MIVARKNERGQAVVLMVLALVVLIGMAAMVLDVGRWWHTRRQLQATSDAAALAGAQMLPDDPAAASGTAMNYADKNGGNVAGADVVISSTAGPNDTIAVKARKNDVGVFSSLLGIGSANIDARAKARVGPPQDALHVAPMVVYCGHTFIHNCNKDSTPDFGPSHMTTMDFNAMGAPGAFGMLNLDGGSGTPGASTEADWIQHGFSKYLPLGTYRSDPGAKFSSQNVQSALDARMNTVLLFPVFKTLNGTGQNAEYEIIGWIGFMLTGYEVHGNNATLHGYFTTFIAEGLLTGSGSGTSGPPNSSSWGVKSIQLVE